MVENDEVSNSEFDISKDLYCDEVIMFSNSHLKGKLSLLESLTFPEVIGQIGSSKHLQKL